MSWLHIVLITWVAVGLLGAPAFVLLAARRAGLRRRDLELNPIAWIPYLAVWVLVGLPLFVILLAVGFIGVPVYAVMTALGFWRVTRVGLRARFLDRGLLIYNQAGTVERVVEWSHVERAEEVFTPPLRSPHLVLQDGERVPLYMITAEELAPVLEEHGIPFDRRWQR